MSYIDPTLNEERKFSKLLTEQTRLDEEMKILNERWREFEKETEIRAPSRRSIHCIFKAFCAYTWKYPSRARSFLFITSGFTREAEDIYYHLPEALLKPVTIIAAPREGRLKDDIRATQMKKHENENLHIITGIWVDEDHLSYSLRKAGIVRTKRKDIAILFRGSKGKRGWLTPERVEALKKIAGGGNIMVFHDYHDPLIKQDLPNKKIFTGTNSDKIVCFNFREVKAC